ncbi:complex I NDUFA9 subunit family protein [Microbulbifer rhizosphaerae]|uniref:NADH dehydrogenase n=1 Tax=Microbulbifer rhizosphaerae TaxID=1562603 RepID=A0A7W4WE67_9GAMM|nr:complex I NDUFA9 subunit family protein [Microbulbifer rhizosphaerae]MBB3062600.1 NADH dehydrogenase [Microbulbifer rhizosphaerae]
MNEQIATVFGGTGFLGRRVVRALVTMGYRVRVAARHPQDVDFSDIKDQITPVAVDIRDERQVTEAITGSAFAVNAVSLYVERGDLTFDAIHVKGAERIARCAQATGVDRLVHISGLGVDERSPSKFIRARARGEQVVRNAFERAILVRPSVMFGSDDAFLASIKTATLSPLVPLFGKRNNRLQPVYVKDVAAAVAKLSRQADGQEQLFELGGGSIYTYRQALQVVMSHLGRRRVLLPVPLTLWRVLVAALSLMPNPPLTRDQLILMQSDNTVGESAKTFADLGIDPYSLEELLDECLPTNSG